MRVIKEYLKQKNWQNNMFIGSDVCNLVLTWAVCNKFAISNQRTELLNHNIPDFPFDKVGADIAHHGGKDCSIVVNYFKMGRNKLGS